MLHHTAGCVSGSCHPHAVPGYYHGVDAGPPLRQHLFEHLSRFIKDYSGINYSHAKLSVLEGRLRKCCRESNFTDINELALFVLEGFGAAHEEMLVKLIDAVTTNKTDFFREPAHFEYIKHQFLPQCCSQERTNIRMWSAACSTGAEPYTLAMVLDDHCRRNRNVSYSIVATDICCDVLEKARLGRYPEAVIEPIPMEWRRRYILRSTKLRSNEVRVAPSLRARVAFGRLNLMNDHYPVAHDFDVIFCRNVLIYFDKPTQLKVLERLCGHLRPGGLLIVGHSEMLEGKQLPVRSVANTVFERI